MSFKEAYDTRIGIFPLYGGFIRAVIDEEGMEKALEYHEKAVERNVKALLQRFKSEQPMSPSEVRDMLQNTNYSSGIDGTVELVDNEVISSNKRCIYYDGWSNGGLSNEEIKQLCSTSFYAYEEVWKNVNPAITVELRKFKKSPEDSCLEVLDFKE